MFTIGPTIELRPLHKLLPTQLTVGMRSVEAKRRELADLSTKSRKNRMRMTLYPAVKGPGGDYYIIDRHHEALAALHEGAKDVSVGLVEDLSHLAESAFWVYLDHRNWVHCYDARGRRRTFDEVPKRLEDMTDDPFRSLAASVLDAGGFSKPDEPFFEFLWANHFRDQMKASRLARNFEKATSEAIDIARSKASRHLPGWAGPK
jgi:hypothetical protein